MGSAPAGAVTAAAVEKMESSCGSGHYCSSWEKREVLLRERSLLGQWGKNREGSC